MTHETVIQGPGGARLHLAAPEHDILAAALDEIRHGGYRKESFARIAAAAGITAAELRRRYPDDACLLVDALRLRDDRGIDLLPDSARDGRAMLQAFIDITRYNAETPGAVEVFATLSAAATAPDHPAHEYFRERYAWQREILIDALRELEEEGELKRSADPEAIAAQTIALLDGLQVQWLLDRGAIDLEKLVRNFLNQYLHNKLRRAEPIYLMSAYLMSA